jgi:hypothetical protein
MRCPEHKKVVNKVASARYAATPKGKARSARYAATPKAKATRARHEATPKAKATRDCYRANNKDKKWEQNQNRTRRDRDARIARKEEQVKELTDLVSQLQKELTRDNDNN